MSARAPRKQGRRRFLAVQAGDLHSVDMRRTRCAWLLLLTGCASAPGPSLGELLRDAVVGEHARLTVEGDQVVAFATPFDYRALPAAARKTCDTVAPEGALLYCASERGPRGAGFRVEKRYQEPVPHERSLLVDAAGRVLERSHTLPVSDAPQHVLGTALGCGPFVERVEIVSGPVREEFWRVLVKDRRGRVFTATIDLGGELLHLRRRSQSRVDS